MMLAEIRDNEFTLVFPLSILIRMDIEFPLAEKLKR